MKTIKEEKKVTSAICDDNGFEIFITYDLIKVIEGWERDEDDMFTALEYHYEIGHVYDIVLECGKNSVSIFAVVSKNSEMENSIFETLFETAKENWNN